uniref:Uncharacterized protein n=1 Tax=Arundo donax TaxID=35708 RepID=A0A0A9A834_ARUDO
MGRPCLSKPWR